MQIFLILADPVTISYVDIINNLEYTVTMKLTVHQEFPISYASMTYIIYLKMLFHPRQCMYRSYKVQLIHEQVVDCGLNSQGCGFL